MKFLSRNEFHQIKIVSLFKKYLCFYSPNILIWKIVASYFHFQTLTGIKSWKIFCLLQENVENLEVSFMKAVNYFFILVKMCLLLQVAVPHFSAHSLEIKGKRMFSLYLVTYSDLEGRFRLLYCRKYIVTILYIKK